MREAYCDDIICDCTCDMKSISTTTMISTDVPPTEIVGDMPAKFINAKGSRHISVK